MSLSPTGVKQRVGESPIDSIRRRDAVHAKFREFVAPTDFIRDYLLEQVEARLLDDSSFDHYGVEHLIDHERKIHASVLEESRTCSAFRDMKPFKAD